MEIRLRQIALVAHDLAAAQGDIAALFAVPYAYDDPGVGKYGLKNAVVPIGMTFLEVVSPKEAGTTAGRLLEKRGGDGGYMVIFQTDDLAAARARVREAGARIVDQWDGNGAAFTHLHPRDLGGAIVSIDAMTPRDRWEWGGPEWQKHIARDRVTAIVGAELQGEAPDKMAARWAEVLGFPAARSGDHWRIGLSEGGELRFVGLKDDRGEGLRAFDVAASDPAAIRKAAAARGLLNDDGTVTLSGTAVVLKG
ncbi:MAG: hypothetical protein GC199_10390 [Alphaproteobacteria bacterium]|nr:hypothetical protein [Alphaproteobacteria bacterium]